MCFTCSSHVLHMHPDVSQANQRSLVHVNVLIQMSRLDVFFSFKAAHTRQCTYTLVLAQWLTI